MPNKLETVAELRMLRIKPFPTAPRVGIRVVRVGTHVHGVDERGTFYGNERARLSCRRLDFDETLTAIERFGLADAKLLQEWADLRRREALKGEAQWSIDSDVQDLAKLGVRLNRKQMATLRAVVKTGQVRK